MKSIVLKKELIHSGKLILVNSELPLINQDEADLVAVDESYPDILIKREAANMLNMAFEKIGCGKQILPVSGYRSAKEQTEIYEASLKENGKEFTCKYVALPYHSEHQTGLAIDIGLNKEEIDFIRPDFPYEGICDKFRNAAHLYGFIERYPKGKEDITGIAHEPWHFRYTGYPHSKIICEKGLALEEYIDFLREHSSQKAPLKCENGQEIFYLEAKADVTEIEIPHQALYQISGNNSDGFIVTLQGDK